MVAGRRDLMVVLVVGSWAASGLQATRVLDTTLSNPNQAALYPSPKSPHKQTVSQPSSTTESSNFPYRSTSSPKPLYSPESFRFSHTPLSLKPPPPESPGG